MRGPPGAESLAAVGQLPRSGRTAPGRAGCARPRPAALQRVPPVGNRGFRGRTAAYRPDPGAVGHWRTRRRPRPVLRRKAHGLCGSLPILRCQERGADRCAGRSRPAPNNHRPAVASRSASRKHGRPDRLGEHEMPMPFGNSKNLAELEPRYGIEPWIFSLPCMIVSSDSVALGRIIAGQSGPNVCVRRACRVQGAARSRGLPAAANAREGTGANRRTRARPAGTNGPARVPPASGPGVSGIFLATGK